MLLAFRQIPILRRFGFRRLDERVFTIRRVECNAFLLAADQVALRGKARIRQRLRRNQATQRLTTIQRAAIGRRNQTS